MTDANSPASTRTSRVIKAPREALYRAFTDPAALAAWLAPGEMTGKVHEFDARVGGGYRMSLFYPSSEETYRGKTSEREDRFENIPPGIRPEDNDAGTQLSLEKLARYLE
jgi:uncharacterized protein YndB with AHSA1/START domain